MNGTITRLTILLLLLSLAVYFYLAPIWAQNPPVISTRTGWKEGRMSTDGRVVPTWEKGQITYADTNGDGRIDYRHDGSICHWPSQNDTNGDGFFDTSIGFDLYIGESRTPIREIIPVPIVL